MGLPQYSFKYHGTDMLSIYNFMVFPVASGDYTGRLSAVLDIWRGQATLQIIVIKTRRTLYEIK